MVFGTRGSAVPVKSEVKTSKPMGIVTLLLALILAFVTMGGFWHYNDTQGKLTDLGQANAELTETVETQTAELETTKIDLASSRLAHEDSAQQLVESQKLIKVLEGEARDLQSEVRKTLEQLLVSEQAIQELRAGLTTSNLEPIRWKMASAFGSSLILLGDGGKMIEERLWNLSNKVMELKFFEPGALVAPLEIFDAVSAGAINAGWTASGYWAGKVPALQFFTAVPFGPDVTEVMTWMYQGGGLELMQEIYARHNIYSQPCSLSSAEGSGWFTKEIKTAEDLKGLKMRFFGLGAKVMEKFGISTQLISARDIYPALEAGTLDATEFSFPAIDLDLGFYEVAKHYYFPGWHQPISMVELMINLDDWNSLSFNQQELINAVCRENLLRTLALGESIQSSAVRELKAKGVTLHRWSPKMLKALESAWQDVAIEEAGYDDDFALVWDSLTKFRESYKIWGDLRAAD